jgi:hypothetical protein
MRLSACSISTTTQWILVKFRVVGSDIYIYIYLSRGLAEQLVGNSVQGLKPKTGALVANRHCTPAGEVRSKGMGWGGGRRCWRAQHLAQQCPCVTKHDVKYRNHKSYGTSVLLLITPLSCGTSVQTVGSRAMTPCAKFLVISAKTPPHPLRIAVDVIWRDDLSLVNTWGRTR